MGPTIFSTAVISRCMHSLGSPAPRRRSNPMAMRALLRKAGQIVGFAGDSEELRAQEADFVLQVDEAVAESDDLAEYVREIAENDRSLDPGRSGELFDEIERFLGAAEPEDEPVRVMYRLAVYTGMRAGELAGLNWDDIDFTQLLGHHETMVLVAEHHRRCQVGEPPQPQSGVSDDLIELLVADAPLPGELARQLGQKAPAVQGKLMALGTMASVNQAVDAETAATVAKERRSLVSPSLNSAVSTIPSERIPMSLAGLRLATIITFSPTRSSGL